jgi:hypothetical protein
MNFDSIRTNAEPEMDLSFPDERLLKIDLDCKSRFFSRTGGRQLHPARRTTTNHVLGPPSLKFKSFTSGRTS